MTTLGSARSSVAGAGSFAWHLGEMVLAMMVGMMVLGGMWSGVLAVAGSSPEAVLDSAPALVAVVLMLNMTVPMIAWMHYRGHSRGELASMASVMGGVGLVAVIALWTSAISSQAICGLECGLMIPAMIAAMWPHRREYGMR